MVPGAASIFSRERRGPLRVPDEPSDADAEEVMYARMNDVQNAARLAMGDYRIAASEAGAARSASWWIVGAAAAAAIALATAVAAFV
jgi:hypothetical protein